MLIIPAIDLRNGNCVRLKQGAKGEETVFSSQPQEIARKWESFGAQRLHLIDLDGAFSGVPTNEAVIQEIRKEITIPIQLGGGIRSLATIEAYLSMGINWVILGTVALEGEDFLSQACSRHPGQIMVGIDARNGKIAIKGWAEQTAFSAIDLARRCEHAGVNAIIYTDIQRDGMLTGVNLASTQEVAQAVSIPVIASGGVATIEDIRMLMPLSRDGVAGVIIGRALHEETIDLKKAIHVGEGELG